MSWLSSLSGRFRMKVPNTYVIIFSVILLCAAATWFVPGGEYVSAGGTTEFREVESVPQTWQVFEALFTGFVQQAGIIVFVLVIGGAFWIVNSTRAVDEGIVRFLRFAEGLERYGIFRRLGVGNMVITMVMLLFGLFGAVFGISEETIAFVVIIIPLAVSLGYDSVTGVCMVYLAAHVGFAGAMLNPFTIGIAQDMAGLPLFSGIEYRTVCWLVLMALAVAFVLAYASRVKRNPRASVMYEADAYWRERLGAGKGQDVREAPEHSGAGAWASYVLITAALAGFCIAYAPSCVVRVGTGSLEAPWLLWVLSGLFAAASPFALRAGRRMYVLNLLGFTILFLVAGVMGYGWYIGEISGLFLALAIASGMAAGYGADEVVKHFIEGAKDIFSAALVIGLAAGIIVILKDGRIIDTILHSMAGALDGAGRAGALGTMYGIQSVINLFITSATAKAAITMPIMAPFADLIGVSRQAMVLAFQFGDGFTNMITPCSGVLLAVLSVARIPYAVWLKWVWKFILLLLAAGFLLLLPTVFWNIPGF